MTDSESNGAAGQLLAAVLTTNELLAAILAQLQGNGGFSAQPAGLKQCAIRSDLLETVSALMGDTPWTCAELVDEARLGSSPEHARVRATLADMDCDQRHQKLGTYLRSRVGAAAGGFALVRHETDRDGARRWSVVRSMTLRDTPQ